MYSENRVVVHEVHAVYISVTCCDIRGAWVWQCSSNIPLSCVGRPEGCCPCLHQPQLRTRHTVSNQTAFLLAIPLCQKARFSIFQLVNRSRQAWCKCTINHDVMQRYQSSREIRWYHFNVSLLKVPLPYWLYTLNAFIHILGGSFLVLCIITEVIIRSKLT